MKKSCPTLIGKKQEIFANPTFLQGNLKQVLYLKRGSKYIVFYCGVFFVIFL